MKKRNPQMYYHGGAGKEFDRVDPTRFAHDSRLGPGYYLTPNREVAEMYAAAKRGHVREIDVPDYLEFFNLSEKVPDDRLDAIVRLVGHSSDSMGRPLFDHGMSGNEVLLALRRAVLGNRRMGVDQTKSLANDVLATAGYDGIRSVSPEDSEIVVVFPQVVGRLKNRKTGKYEFNPEFTPVTGPLRVTMEGMGSFSNSSAPAPIMPNPHNPAEQYYHFVPIKGPGGARVEEVIGYRGETYGYVQKRPDGRWIMYRHWDFPDRPNKYIDFSSKEAAAEKLFWLSG
jgi:hypothetical protein